MSTRHLVDPEPAAMLDQLPHIEMTQETRPLICVSSAAMLATMPTAGFIWIHGGR